MSQPQLINQLVTFSPPFLPGNSLNFKDGHDVFFHRQLAKNRWFLRQVADSVVSRPQVHGNVSNIFPINQNAATVRWHQAYRHIKTGGFTGSIGSTEPYYFRLIYVEADAIYHPAPTVRFRDVVRGQGLHLLLTRVSIPDLCGVWEFLRYLRAPYHPEYRKSTNRP